MCSEPINLKKTFHFFTFLPSKWNMEYGQLDKQQPNPFSYNDSQQCLLHLMKYAPKNAFVQKLIWALCVCVFVVVVCGFAMVRGTYYKNGIQLLYHA